MLENRRVKVCLGVKQLKQVEPGSKPKNPKTSTRNSSRPRVASKDPAIIKAVMTVLWGTVKAYKEASHDYRSGNLNAAFPRGTYKPPLFTKPATGEGILAALK